VPSAPETWALAGMKSWVLEMAADDLPGPHAWIVMTASRAAIATIVTDRTDLECVPTVIEVHEERPVVDAMLHLRDRISGFISGSRCQTVRSSTSRIGTAPIPVNQVRSVR
jgi:hypothetical protein